MKIAMSGAMTRRTIAWSDAAPIADYWNAALIAPSAFRAGGKPVNGAV